jgi:hypothetical protein
MRLRFVSGLDAISGGPKIVCCLSLCLLLPSARGQQRGAVEGRVINKTDSTIAAAGVDLDVVNLASGMTVLQSGKTDAAGRFRFDGLPTDGSLMIRADYKDVSYLGHLNFDASGKASLEIPVYEPASSSKDIRLESVHLGFQLSGDSLRSMELYSFENKSSPPRTYMSMEGTFRFAKAPDLAEPPKLSVTGPGATMPVTQSPLESADGRSYYSLYALRPGTTTFEVEQSLPYAARAYSLKKKFYYDVASYEIGVIPRDLSLSGNGLTRVQVDPQRNFTVYRGGPVKAGAELVWEFSGGTQAAEPAQTPGGGVQSVPDAMAQNALALGSLLLLGFIAVLWYAINRLPQSQAGAPDARLKELRRRRDRLLDHLADLDQRRESREISPSDYARQRNQGKRQLRRIYVLLKKP